MDIFLTRPMYNFLSPTKYIRTEKKNILNLQQLWIKLHRIYLSWYTINVSPQLSERGEKLLYVPRHRTKPQNKTSSLNYWKKERKKTRQCSKYITITLFNFPPSPALIEEGKKTDIFSDSIRNKREERRTRRRQCSKYTTTFFNSVLLCPVKSLKINKNK